MDGIRMEYEAIKSMSGMAYKLLNVIRFMTMEGCADDDGYVTLSHAKISMKLGIGNNVTRIISDLEAFPHIIEIKRGDTKTPNRFKVNDSLLF